MAFQGSLKELPLPDIIQLVAVSGKTGVFVLSSQAQKGEIFLREGEIVHALTGAVRGEEAVYELAIWQEGEFLFKPGVETEERTVRKSNTNLLMEAARRIDEWQVLSKRIPSTRMVPFFTSHSTSTSISFTPQEWAVICKVDERRTIDELAGVLGVSAFDVCKLLYGLITAGLVELRENIGQVQVDRLRRMCPPELLMVAKGIHEQAKVMLASHERAGDLDVATRRAQADMAAGRGADAVIEMVRGVEQVIQAALGPNQSRIFLEKVNQQLGS